MTRLTSDNTYNQLFDSKMLSSALAFISSMAFYFHLLSYLLASLASLP